MKKSLMKVACSLFAAFAMIFTLFSFPITANAEETNEMQFVNTSTGEEYKTLSEALNYVQKGDTLKLLKDVPDATGVAVKSGSDFTLDFDGHTYTLAGAGAGSSGTETNGFQFLQNSTIVMKNGIVKLTDDASQKNIKRIIQNYANLTLEDMIFETSNLNQYEDYALSFNNGDIHFKGKTSIITSSPDVIAFDICKFSSYPGATVTFEDNYTGSINGTIMYDSTDANTHKLIVKGNGTFAGISTSSNASSEAAKDAITISGGTFKTDVSDEYFADGYNPVKQEDGTIIVCNHVDTETEIRNYKEATCTENGYTGDTYCKKCGTKLSDGQIITAKGHEYQNNWTFDESSHWKECINCGVKKDSATHVFNWVIDTEATSTENGIKHEECEICGYKKESITIPALSSKPNSQNSSGSVDTGDKVNVALPAAMTVISGMLIASFVIYKKR